MLPTWPRAAARSTSSSCTTPAPATATRVSCGVTLIRISSSLMGVASLKQLRRLVKRQSHDPRVAAAQLGDEARGAALDGVAARLVAPFTGGDVLPDLLGRELLEAHFRARQGAFHPVAVFQRDRGEHFVLAVRQRGE